MRDLETRRWFDSLPDHGAVGGWKVFKPDYAQPVFAETLAFQRMLNRRRIEFHPVAAFVFRLRPAA